MEQESTIRPKKNTAIKRNQTFAAADGIRYTPKLDGRRKGGNFRCYTVPLFPPLSASVEVLTDGPVTPLDTKANLTNIRAALSRDQLHQTSTILADQFSPSVLSASSGYGSIGLAWSEASLRSFNRSLTAASPDSAISLFSSTPSKIGSIAAKKRLHFDEVPEEYQTDLIDQDQQSICTSLIKYAPVKAAESHYVTSVFEVVGQGLKDMADWVHQEMHHFYSRGLLIVCCEVRWSTPDRYRDIESETRLKGNVLRGLHLNNNRVWDTTELGGGSVIEEVMARKWSCTGGSYRRFYSDLLRLVHEETGREHEPYWHLTRGLPLDESIDWPVIGPKAKTSVLMLNMICLKI